MYNQRTQFNATSEKLVPECVFQMANLKERMDKVLPRALEQLLVSPKKMLYKKLDMHKHEA